jgi:anaphase-promoting complex subunit 2
MLSNRLLSQFSYNTEREIRNLELLKLRFGEASLQQCEVMLKDISDSKRINNAITGEDLQPDGQSKRPDGEERQPEGRKLLVGQPFPVNAVILSAQFWPQFKEQENLLLPKEVLIF